MSQTTKRALEESLKRMLLVKPLDKITISDIAQDCGINRMFVVVPLKLAFGMFTGLVPLMPVTPEKVCVPSSLSMMFSA
jgi:hypothetical protein